MKKAGKILALAGPRYIDALPERDRPRAIDVLNQIHKTVNTFNDERAAVAVNTHLTPQGRSESSAKTRATALAQLEDIETNTIKKLNERAESLESALRAKVGYAKPKDAAQEAQLREIRESMRGLSAAQRLDVYRSSTDPLVLAAIETAPMTLNTNLRRAEPFIDPAEVDAAVMARAEVADPASANTLREVRSLAEVYGLAVNTVRKEILDA
jgi:hypothetical protein